MKLADIVKKDKKEESPPFVTLAERREYLESRIHKDATQKLRSWLREKGFDLDEHIAHIDTDLQPSGLDLWYAAAHIHLTDGEEFRVHLEYRFVGMPEKFQVERDTYYLKRWKNGTSQWVQVNSDWELTKYLSEDYDRVTEWERRHGLFMED